MILAASIVLVSYILLLLLMFVANGCESISDAVTNVCLATILLVFVASTGYFLVHLILAVATL